MENSKTTIGVLGVGRMGRGIALSYIFAGVPVLLVDMKQRTDEQRVLLIDSAIAEIRADLEFLAGQGLFAPQLVDAILHLLSFSHLDDAALPLAHCGIVYEGVPELMEAKQAALGFASDCLADDAIIASTTSTFLVTELAGLVANSARFMNAHWLNPAHLMPLVELSRSDDTGREYIDTLVKSLESIGKVPVECSASPGYIVPRIQALVMNEAARLVQEGVASAEDVDKALKLGFGLRFSVLGVLEFIDWGGGDILYYASKYLENVIGPRFQAPDIIESNMHSARNGLRDGRGFYNYQGVDTHTYRSERLADFVSALKHKGLLPNFKAPDAQ